MAARTKSTKKAAKKATPKTQHRKPDGPVARVWAIADKMKDATRGEVVAACVEQGINAATARTQYQAWSKAK